MFVYIFITNFIYVGSVYFVHSGTPFTTNIWSFNTKFCINLLGRFFTQHSVFYFLPIKPGVFPVFYTCLIFVCLFSLCFVQPKKLDLPIEVIFFQISIFAYSRLL